MTKNGGYVIIDLNDTTKIYKQALGCLNSGKPVLVYDASNIYYADTIAKVGDDVVITKGGKTITITDANSVSSTGIVKAPTMENIVDLAGHNRFIEGTGTPNTTISGLDISYCRWSLSGTHLMMVCAGTLANGTELAQNNSLALFTLPEYILDKIYPVWGGNVLEGRTVTARDDSWGSQTFNVAFNKVLNGVQLSATSNLTVNADRGFRIQFDLLIDAE